MRPDGKCSYRRSSAFLLEEEIAAVEDTIKILNINEAFDVFDKSVNTLSKEAAEIDAVVADAAAIREKEKAEFLVTKKHLSESEEAILGVLKIAEFDFAKSLAEVRTVEESAADAYNKMMKENEMSEPTKEVNIKGKQSESKSPRIPPCRRTC